MLCPTWSLLPHMVIFLVCVHPMAGQCSEPVQLVEQPELIVRQLASDYCYDCHNPDEKVAELDLESIQAQPFEQNADIWEKVLRKVRARQMPPSDYGQPDEMTYATASHALGQVLEAQAASHPRPGRVETFRRLTRFEYQNAIRDLLALEIDATRLLPADESSHGFDNVTVGMLSPTLLNRYIAAAERISRLAVGGRHPSPTGRVIRISPDTTQEERVAGLPLGTRGGLLTSHYFPQDGEYEIQVRLARDRNEHVEGLKEPHQLEILLDRKPIKQLTVKPPQRKESSADAEYDLSSHANVDRHLKVLVTVAAGSHQLGVTFRKNASSLLETKRQPLNVHYNMNRHPRLTPAIYEVSITGPFKVAGPGHSPSRERVLSCQPKTSDDEEACARQIVSQLMRRAYRRPVEESDLTVPLRLYAEGRAQADFETGIEWALSAILVNPQFLFRVEKEPDDLAADFAYAISDLELASRLSFFLWSSIPDEELLEVAERGELSDPEVLVAQTRRMLADVRAKSLVSNFAGQWLHLRNLDASTPDARLFPDFDDNLRQAFRQETELFFESIIREDHSVLDLLQADYTYLNERLAKHYNIPHVYGSRFRRVSLEPESHRGGLLRQGSILTVTSYATRTSPVIRGKWILGNLLGTPPPPPPPDVPDLKDNTVAANLSVRERLAEHRANPACASCHNFMDPPGFALENFDALGRWREIEGGQPVDATGGLPDGSEFTGIDGLEAGLLNRPELFVGTMAEKLLTYALGRGIEPYDGPAVRKIVRESAREHYRFSSLLVEIVKSVPFRMRSTGK
ncbi:DUF1592 domain-containing protein [Adhaeretor mobilis]|uniref:DUF1592 domain-containing protein n=1 Tax=Adhaeretor mobilis TaxID=1930276 RepID=A0A517N128_9BACT|nr:DUF1592 domain-containing protein [Adhaeretor mobilis]QDT00718.1 hypothetical protein HG15A2_40580 [Adhaeretor mobilis]